MGISDIVGAISSGIVLGITIACIAIIIILVVFLIIIPMGTLTWQNRHEIVREMDDTIKTVKDAVPPVLDAAKTYCSLDQTVLEQLRPNTIAPYMLNNVGAREKSILENWKNTGNITPCEIKILDENIDDYYKKRLNLRSVTKTMSGCNLVECLDKYKLIENLTSHG